MSPRAATTSGILSLVVLLAALPASAQPAPSSSPANRWQEHRHVMEEMADHRMERLFERLHLTADQRTRMQAIRTRERQATTDARKHLDEKRKALLLLIRRPDATRDQALALQHEIDALQAQLAESRLSAWFEARGVLTPEQLAELAKLRPMGGPQQHGPHR